MTIPIKPIESAINKTIERSGMEWLKNVYKTYLINNRNQ
jgi:hypothetical protein